MDTNIQHPEPLEPEFKNLLKDYTDQYELKYLGNSKSIEEIKKLKQNLLDEIQAKYKNTQNTQEQKELQKLEKEIKDEQTKFEDVLKKLDAWENYCKNVEKTINESDEQLEKRMEDV